MNQTTLQRSFFQVTMISPYAHRAPATSAAKVLSLHLFKPAIIVQLLQLLPISMVHFFSTAELLHKMEKLFTFIMLFQQE